MTVQIIQGDALTVLKTLPEYVEMARRRTAQQGLFGGLAN